MPCVCLSSRNLLKKALTESLSAGRQPCLRCSEIVFCSTCASTLSLRKSRQKSSSLPWLSVILCVECKGIPSYQGTFLLLVAFDLSFQRIPDCFTWIQAARVLPLRWYRKIHLVAISPTLLTLCFCDIRYTVIRQRIRRTRDRRGVLVSMRDVIRRNMCACRCELLIDYSPKAREFQGSEPEPRKYQSLCTRRYGKREYE
ncbi:hypothetical protein BJ138DRAFT_1166025 [Hygrophoropsis aurantiaca]|uniref:Uncharacterized protein n=1 Tax=Hygrophoropsis aurantiaca TaxID=72124 RepID=A0ACB7ZVQ1_9AGAM|nr:hypothetical protein BJ138DRAFT_1166025 [Hygrophoropsis aurantiaca]